MSNINNRPPNDKSGLFHGERHNDPVTGQAMGGIQTIVDGSQVVEIEGEEYFLCRESMESSVVYNFQNKTNKQVLDKLFREEGCVFEQGKARSGDFISCRLVVLDDKPINRKGTVKEIVNEMQKEKACRMSNDYSKRKLGGVFKETTPEELEARWGKKRESIEKLANNIQRLRYNISSDLKSDNPKIVLTALAVSLMDKTFERVGNEASAKVGHVGISGLKKSQVAVIGNKIHLEYVGKSGVEHTKSFSDERIAKHLKKAIKNSPSKRVFTTSDGFQIKADRTNRYLSDFDITAKDIRGFGANNQMVSKLEKQEIPEKETDRKKLYLKTLRSVAEKVGHGFATLRKHYVIPQLERAFVIDGKAIDISDRSTYEDGGGIESNKESEIAKIADILEKVAKTSTDIKIPYSGNFADGKEFNIILSKAVEYKDFSGTIVKGFKGLANSTVPYSVVAEKYYENKSNNHNLGLVRAVETILNEVNYEDGGDLNCGCKHEEKTKKIKSEVKSAEPRGFAIFRNQKKAIQQDSGKEKLKDGGKIEPTRINAPSVVYYGTDLSGLMFAEKSGGFNVMSFKSKIPDTNMHKIVLIAPYPSHLGADKKIKLNEFIGAVIPQELSIAKEILDNNGVKNIRTYGQSKSFADGGELESKIKRIQDRILDPEISQSLKEALENTLSQLKLEQEGKMSRIMRKEDSPDVEFSGIAPIITSEKTGDIREYRQSVKDFLNSDLLNKFVINKHTGEEIHFTKISVGELLQKTGDNKLRALFHIKEIVANATPVKVEELIRENNPLKRNSDFIYTMESTIMIDNQWYEYNFKTIVKLSQSKDRMEKIVIYSGHLPKEKPI